MLRWALFSGEFMATALQNFSSSRFPSVSLEPNRPLWEFILLLLLLYPLRLQLCILVSQLVCHPGAVSSPSSTDGRRVVQLRISSIFQPLFPLGPVWRFLVWVQQIRAGKGKGECTLTHMCTQTQIAIKMHSLFLSRWDVPVFDGWSERLETTTKNGLSFRSCCYTTHHHPEPCEPVWFFPLLCIFRPTCITSPGLPGLRIPRRREVKHKLSRR